MTQQPFTTSDPGSIPDAVSPLTAREAIRDALFRYCSAIDRREFGRVATSFHADAEISGISYSGKLSGFVRFVEEHNASISVSSHMIGNVLFDFVDNRTADVESYCSALQELRPIDPSGKSKHREVRLRYQDRFELRERQWRIAKRTLLTDIVVWL